MGRSTVAVVGAGVSGLSAAYVLQRRCDVTIFEADPRLGGHAHTHQVPLPDGGSLAVDTGFMVFNEKNYPRLMRIFGELGVQTQGSDMSMSLVCDGCGLEYVAGGFLATPPQLREQLDEATWRAVTQDARRFTELVPNMLADDTLGNRTLGEVLDAHCDYFAEHLVLPLVSAVWSCGAKTAREYPVRYLLQFLDNHGVLPTTPALRWRTVVGGSRTYVEKIAATLSSVQVATPVRAVRRTAQGVEVHDEGDRRHSFDRAVLAVHPHEALRILSDATAAERQVLQAIPYLRNSVVLHTDVSVLPSAERNRASWNNRRVTCEPGDDRLVMHYHLNRLQRIDAPVDYIATLGAEEIKPESVLARMVYEHPVYTPESVAARQRLPELSGGVLAFAGAYHGWGFHEDGCLSGVLAAQALGVRW